MAMQYRVGNFFIDLSRNQITQKELTQTLAPKALAVLTYLAQHQGKVVSYDDLLTNVWPDTIVTPNTLQRSIAQLRKALGEDSKIQSYIKTHAKQGYSLECNVQWNIEAEKEVETNQDSTLPESPEQQIATIENQPQQSTTELSQPSSPDNSNDITTRSSNASTRLKIFSVITSIIILGFIALTLFTPTPATKIVFDTLKPLTATKNKEFGASYTHDGKFIIFHRYVDEKCGNKIWAKNIETQQETLLTERWGKYGSHSLSQDGKTLAFIEVEDCTKPVNQTTCYNLVQVDLHKALQQPSSPSVLMQCKNSKIKKPIWLNNNEIALLQNSNNQWQLILYSVKENTSKVLYSIENGNIHHFDYSAEEGLISIFSYLNDHSTYLDMIKKNGQLISKNQINYPEGIAKYRLISPRFLPNSKQLMFSTGRRLYTMSFEGEITKANLPLDESVGSPRFHPRGKKILLIKGRYDSDIFIVPRDLITQPVQTSPEQRLNKDIRSNSTVMEQSVFSEDYATFQPSGDLIAYVSRRTSEDQIWVTGPQGAKQLSNFPIDTYISGIYWSADGKSLLVNHNSMLSKVDVNQNQKTYDLDYPVTRFFQWDSIKNTALLTVHIEGADQFVELDLNTKELTYINNKSVLWAQRSEDGQLIIKDTMNRYWQPGPAENKLIEPLIGQGDSERFIITNNTIYGLNKQKQLWSYDLKQESFKILKEMHKDLDFLTDLNQNHFLMTYRTWAKKEVVELTLLN